MKRQWRPGRTLLTMLLMSLAVMCYYAWPKQPLWSLSFDMAKDWYELLGVDEARQIVYVNYVDHDDVNPRYPVNRRSELRGYDLYSGKLIWRLPDTDGVFRNHPLAWDYWLSPDKSQVVCYEHGNETLQIRAFPSCKLQYQIKIDEKEVAEGLFARYSDDGSKILVLTRSHVHFYDSSTGRMEYSLEIPELPEPKTPDENVNWNDDKYKNAVGYIIPTSNGNWAQINGYLQLSNDKHFLAIVGKGTKSVLVFHIPTRKLLAQLPFSGIPRFLRKEYTLLLIPQFHLPDRPVNNQLKRFTVSENGVSEISSQSEHPATNGETVYCDERHLVTNEVQLHNLQKPPFWTEWKWLPDTIKMKLVMMLYAKVRIDFYDPASGKQLESFFLPLSNVYYASYLQRNWLSSDAKLLALNDGTTLAFWKISRPVMPGLFLTVAIIVCLWLAWPCKPTTTLPAASPHADK